MLKLLNKKLMIAVNILLFVMGVFFSIIIFYNLFNTPTELASSSNIYNTILEDCEEKAESLGFTQISVRNNIIKIQENTIEDPMDVATKSSMLQNYCKKLELYKYCLGDECQSNMQFRMTMRINDEN